MENFTGSRRTQRILESVRLLFELEIEEAARGGAPDPEVSDFAFGNPNEMPLPGVVDALQKWTTPHNYAWYAYKMNERASTRTIADVLHKRRGMLFEPEDIFVTNGAFGGLAVVLAAITEPGDEVIINLPPWFFYEALTVTYGAEPVKVRVRPDNFDLDLDAIAAAITPRTRAILINTPNNPTGRIYPPETLKRLAEILRAASGRYGRTIFLVSDEAYSRILFDNAAFPSPTEYYPHSFLVYTFGKTLLTPGERIGYIALPPAMPNRAPLRNALFAAQTVTGYAFANAVLQYALADLETLSIDIPHLQFKRDWLARDLRAMGYSLQLPEGTFYLLVKSPIPDDTTFVRRLAQHKVRCLPGTVFELPGYFRLSLTANDDMIRRALPAFAAVMAELA